MAYPVAAVRDYSGLVEEIAMTLLNTLACSVVLLIALMFTVMIFGDSMLATASV